MRLLGICLNPLCMVTEFLSGRFFAKNEKLIVVAGDLGSYLANFYADKDLPSKLRIGLALDMARGLRFLHTMRPPLIHNDIKR